MILKYVAEKTVFRIRNGLNTDPDQDPDPDADHILLETFIYSSASLLYIILSF